MTSRSPRRMPTSSKTSERAETRGATGPRSLSAAPVVVALVRLGGERERRQQRRDNAERRAESAET